MTPNKSAVKPKTALKYVPPVRLKRSGKATKPDIISFRITVAQSRILQEIFKRDAASGINSSNQLARKVVCDYIAGRLSYSNPKDKLQDLDLLSA